MKNQELIGSVRRALEAERDDLLARIEELETNKDDRLDYDDNFADSGQVAAELGENQALMGSMREQLTDVTAALGRIDDGSYGRCEVCGEEIQSARLEAMPHARFCINHA